MSDQSLVTRNVLTRVLEERASEDVDTNLLKQLASREPILAAYLSERVVTVSGKLALSGAPPDVVRACHDDLVAIVDVAVRALWKGQDEFWKGIDLTDLANTNRRRLSGRSKAKAPRGATSVSVDGPGDPSASDNSGTA